MPTTILVLAFGCDATPGAIDRPAAVVATPDDAVPTSTAPAGPTPGPGYGPSMIEGRDAFERHDYAAAVIAFERALASTPDDPRALSELGWAALHAGDLESAERALVRATELDTEPKLAAASLYNLGRVREAQGRNPDAVALYQRSLELRDSRTVRARIGQLGASASKAMLDVEILAGPFDSIEAWCSEHALAALPGTTARCDTELAERKGLVIERPTIDATTGILEARFVATAGDGALLQYHLALRTDSGWFVRADLAAHGNAGTGSGRAELSHLGIEVVDLVPAGGVELLIRIDEAWIETTRGRDGAVVHEDRRSDRSFCGTGASGRPACTSPIPLTGALRELAGRGKGPLRSEQHWRLSLRVAKRKVVLTGDTDAVDDAHRVWLGTHAIVFP